MKIQNNIRIEKFDCKFNSEKIKRGIDRKAANNVTTVVKETVLMFLILYAKILDNT